MKYGGNLRYGRRFIETSHDRNEMRVLTNLSRGNIKLEPTNFGGDEPQWMREILGICRYTLSSTNIRRRTSKRQQACSTLSLASC